MPIDSNLVALVARQREARQNAEDPLDKIVKGLDIAGRVYGIKEASDKSSMMKMDLAARNKSLEDTSEMNAQLKDPNSLASKIYANEFERQYGEPIPEGKTAYDIKNFFDPKKLGEIKAAAAVNFDNQSSLKKMDNDALTARAEQLRLSRMTELERSEELKKNREIELQKLKTSESLQKLKTSASLKGSGKAKEEKNIPASVYAAATYGTRAEDANIQMKELMQKGFDPTAPTARVQSSKYYPDLLMGENNKLMEQAKRNFTNAALRRESGAAIAASEFASADAQYFPAGGDTPAVLAQKERNREVVISGMKAEGAKALPKIHAELSGRPNKGLSDLIPKSQGKPPVIQNGIQYNWNPKTGKYE